MKKFKSLVLLFWAMFKIGLFTFGGGYAMIAIIERELVERKKWIEHDEFMDMIAIAESTPGPIAINSATYIGYKRGGVLGSLFATLGVVLPSFTIIFIISLFYKQFMQIQLVAYAFKGIQACVAFLILSAGFKMLKKIKHTPLNIIVFILTIGGLLTLSVFFPSIEFSSVFYILIGGTIGLIVYFICCVKNGKKKPVLSKNDDLNGDIKADDAGEEEQK